MIEKSTFANLIKAAGKKEKCDLVIKNISVVDVFQGECFLSDVAIRGGFIVGLGEYEGKEFIDGTGKYICPGLIDAHAHIESSLTMPQEYSKIALIHGVTSLIADPHEIANVLGVQGIELMLDASEGLPFDFYFMLSSCVPATSFENAGAKLSSRDLKPFYSKAKVLGLAEVMDSPAVSNCDDDMLDKILDARNRNLVVDGHCAAFGIDMLNIYGTSGIKTDHECQSVKEVIDRIRRGFYILIREGTAAKNLKDLIKVANVSNSRRICFCTDDKHIDELFNSGSIDDCIRQAIGFGIKPEIVIQMATLNVAECYGLKFKGAIAPGYIGDFIILDDLENFKINSVYKNGTLIVKNNKFESEEKTTNSIINTENTVRIPELTKESFEIKLKGFKILNVIEIIPNKLETNHLRLNIRQLSYGDSFIADIQNDLVKIAVIERHKKSGNIGLGVLKGLKLKEGAIATTIAHDSHNIIVCGCNDGDMLIAVEELKKIGGGITVVKDGMVLSSVRLEVGGLMSSRASEEIINDMDNIHKALESICGNINFNPFLTLSFLSLPVIPDLKITDKGLFNVKSYNFIDVAE